MRKTIPVDQDNIDLLRKQFSELLIASLADFGDMPVEHEATLLTKFTKAYIHCQNSYKEYGSNTLFQEDLEAQFETDSAYTTKPLFTGLLKATQVVMDKWEQDAFRSWQCVQGDTKNKGTAIVIDRNKRPRPCLLEAP